MAIYVGAGDSKTFTPAPAGVHSAVCVDVVDMGLIKVTWNGQEKTQHKLRIVWEIDDEMEDGRRYIVQKRYTASLHEKAMLRKDLESWRGRAFTGEESRRFDVEALIGVPCMVNVMHATRDGDDRTFANVTAVMPVPKSMAKITPSQDYVRVQDRPADAKPTNGHNGQAAEDPFGNDLAPGLTDDDIPF